MIEVYLNDKSYKINPNSSLQEFLLDHNYKDLHFAIVINNTFISRITYKDLILQEGDRVMMLVPMQGG